MTEPWVCQYAKGAIGVQGDSGEDSLSFLSNSAGLSGVAGPTMPASDEFGPDSFRNSVLCKAGAHVLKLKLQG